MSAKIKIETVKTQKDLDAFIKLPWSIYKGDPNWVPPLLSEVREILDTARNPFWQHARREIFLARDMAGNPVGRIVAIIDPSQNEFHGDKTGFFGFFECVNDQETADLLFDEAKKCLKAGGMTVMRGPMNPSMNDECGFLLEGFDSPPVAMMTYTPQYYLELAQHYGLRKAKDLYALIKMLKDGVPERLGKIIDRTEKNTRVKVRQLEMKNFVRDIQYLKDIYNSAWEKNWGFIPMTSAEMDLAAEKLKQFVKPELVLFAEIDGQPVGVSVTVPDINQVLIKLDGKLGPVGLAKFLYYRNKIDGIRSLIGGVKKEYRNTGIISVLYRETEKAAVRLGYKWCELSWNLEDNDLINKFDEALGGKVYKKYRICETDI
jgi:GNAT superfamily N-acetyltransferase